MNVIKFRFTTNNYKKTNNNNFTQEGIIILYLMKTPERSRTSRDPQLYSPFVCYGLRDTQINFVMSRDVMSSYCCVTWSHTIGHKDFTWEFNSGKSLKITFADLVTLTFDLRPWPTIPTYVISRSTSMPKIKVIGQTVQPWEYTHTDRNTAPILWPRPLTREVKITEACGWLDNEFFLVCVVFLKELFICH